LQDLRIKRDVGIFQLRSGTVSFLTPVLDHVTMAVFSGEGSFVLEPNLPHEVRNLAILTGEQSVQEPFQQAVFWFTDETDKEIRKYGETGSAPQVADVLRKFRSEMRKRRENSRSSLEAMMTSEAMDNVEADIFTALYDPGAEPFFNALIFGKKHSHLRLHLRPTGAVPDMMTEEEVALINLAPEKQDEGILYLAPAEGRPERAPDIPQRKHRVDVTHYRIDSELAGNRDLSGSTVMTFKPRYGGDRMLKLSLLPTLRVSGVKIGGDQPLTFIQEPKEEDASFYVIFPVPLEKDREYQLGIEYQGNKVVYDYGGGNFAVGARTSWYPNVNTFSDPATFELTFAHPKKGALVSVGKRVDEKTEGKTVRSQWRSDIPLKVAGFNYGRYKQQNLTEEQSGYEIEAFATTEVPDFLRSTAGSLPGTTSRMPSTKNMTPSSILKKVAAETRASILIFNRFFGEAPYGRIAVTQHPQFSFGQSWPTLAFRRVCWSSWRWSLSIRIGSHGSRH